MFMIKDVYFDIRVVTVKETRRLDDSRQCS